MRIAVVVEGRSEEVRVDLEVGTVELRGKSYPFKIVSSEASRVELEIAGERALVDGWPAGILTPPGPLDVNGERWSATVSLTAEAGGSSQAVRVRSPTKPSGSLAEREERGTDTSSGSRTGIPLIPPMPGRVVELKVTEGDRVVNGQVLLVLEAMKMRNEVTSPATGRVVQVKVVAGANARAREPLLFVIPD